MSITAPRLGAITESQIQEAFHRFSLGDVIAVSPTSNGMGGQNLFVTSTSREYVFRGNPLYPGQFAKERFFAHLLHTQASLPVPYPYHVDDSAEIFVWSYAIMPRLPGATLSALEAEAPLSQRDLHAITHLLAETLAQLQEATWPHVGEYHPETDTIVPLAGSLTDRESGFVHIRLAWARDRTGRIDEADVRWAEEVLARGRTAVDHPPAPTVVLHDYQVGNMVFAREADHWSVTGVFDFAEAYIGDPEVDLARTINGLLHGGHVDLAHLLVQDYDRLRGIRPGLADRLATYLLDFLIIEWGFDSHRHASPFRSWADERLSLLPLVAAVG